MTTVTVRAKDDQTFEVHIGAATPTTHTVTLRPDDYQRLTGGRVSAEVLIEESFKFLLEREPNTSILRHFDLPVIGQYFPDYEKLIERRLGVAPAG